MTNIWRLAYKVCVTVSRLARRIAYDADELGVECLRRMK
jgi:hypothetical protein